MGEGVKVLPLASEVDCRSLLLHLQPDSVTVPHWRRQRPSLFIQSVSHSASQDGKKRTMALEGFVRHRALSANQIMTLPIFGDYAIEKITVLKKDQCSQEDVTAMDDCAVYPDPELQESLVKQNDVVPEEEMQESDGHRFHDSVHTAKKLVPKGTSAYQATWIPDDDSLTESGSEISSQNADNTPELIPEDDIDALRETRSIGDGIFSSVTKFALTEIPMVCSHEYRERER